MDRPRRRSGVLIAPRLLVAGAVAWTLAAARADTVTVPLRVLRWTAPGAEVVRILTRRPVECLAVPADPEAAYRVEVGRAAFRDPLLLGGQAARAGIACESCHRNGRTNPDFAFPGLSGAPGTADVTSFVFSTHRGDHVDDPRPIPDLGGPKVRLKVDQSPASPALGTFIHGLVVEEFEGAEPPPGVLEGLAAYVRALNPAACADGGAGGGFERVTAAAAIADVLRAAAARAALAHRDGPVALAMIQAARAQLGDLAEHFDGRALTAERQRLTHASFELAYIADAVRRTDPGADRRLAAWLRRAPAWRAALLNAEPRSLYDKGRVETALSGGQAPAPSSQPRVR
ncbi:MAG: hypothetical protein JWO83_3926 [Caulobacteraceae bacterium]|nr:hypothetical protein [Caulobacteraceae bacterium]